jgi:hypothetical protein
MTLAVVVVVTWTNYITLTLLLSWISSCPPPTEPTLIGRVINGSIALTLMSDHTAAA